MQTSDTPHALSGCMLNGLTVDALQFHCKPFAELTVQELDALYRLRQAVFVVEQDCPYLDADGVDALCWHVWATAGTKPDKEVLAVARLAPAGVKYAECSIGRVANHEQVRGKGVGRALIRQALAHVDAWNAETGTSGVRISAQVYLQRFYESFGFEVVGEPYLEDDLPHIEMLRK